MKGKIPIMLRLIIKGLRQNPHTKSMAKSLEKALEIGTPWKQLIRATKHWISPHISEPMRKWLSKHGEQQ